MSSFFVSKSFALNCFLGLLCFIFNLSVLAPVWGQVSEEVNPALAKQAVADLLPAIPSKLQSEGLSSDDFVKVNPSQDSVLSLYISLDSQKRVMPDIAWHKNHLSYCRSQARQVGDADTRVEFKIYKHQEKNEDLERTQYTTVARLVDANTNIIKRQASAESTVGQEVSDRGGIHENPDQHINSSINEALEQLGFQLVKIDDGCGFIQLTHLSGSTVEDEFVFEVGFQNESASNLSYQWDFGDGAEHSAQGRDQLARHTYQKAGTYTVTVMVDDGDDKTESASVRVTVKDKEEDEKKNTAIQPRDGKWIIRLVNHTMKACSSRIRAGVESTMQNMIGLTQEHYLQFPTPFHPDPLMYNIPKKLDWQQIGKNYWKTVFKHEINTGMSYKVEFYMQPINTALIKAQVHQDIHVSPQIIRKIGGSTRCISDADYEYQWQE